MNAIPRPAKTHSRPVLLPLALTVIIAAASAATIRVDSVDTLRAAIDRAQPGDRIVLQNGAYTTHDALKITCAGTEAAPIVIAAETVGGVEIAGAAGFEAVAPAAFVTLEGFRFTHASGKTTIGSGTRRVRFSRNTFVCPGEGPYLLVSGDEAEVDHNEFRDKRTLGNMISVTGTGSQVARKLWIHHNYFHDFADAHGNGAETIRFGLSGLSMSTGNGLVESNLFVHCEGENELISNKSSGNTYRYNTFLDAPGAQLTLRHGNECVVYGNYFRNTDGLRIFGDRHAVMGNYFENNRRGINLGNGDGEVADGAALTSHDRPDGCIIAFNTLLGNATHYQMDGRKEGLGATHTTFARNIVAGGGVVAKIDGPNPDARWFGNVTAHTGNAGSLPPAGFAQAEAHFIITGDGHLLAVPGPVTLASSRGFYPAAISLDRVPVAKADAALNPAYTVRGALVKILSPADVGPGAK